VQRAYEALTDRSGSGSSALGGPSQAQAPQGGGGPFASFWRAYQRAPPQRIPSDTDDLDAGAFHRRVLAADASAPGAGGAWLLQVFSHGSPYCRALSPHWEAAARELGGAALSFARIDADAHPMLVGSGAQRS
jgi:hypothetical protein